MVSSLGVIIFAIILVTIATVLFIVNAIAFLRLSNAAATNTTGTIVNNGTTFSYNNTYATTVASSARTYYIVNAVFAGIFGAAWLIIILIAFLSFRRRSEVVAEAADLVDQADRRGRREVTTTTTEVTTVPVAPVVTTVPTPAVTTVQTNPGLSLQGVSVGALQFQPVQAPVTQYSATQQANGAYQVNLVSPGQGPQLNSYGQPQVGLQQQQLLQQQLLQQQQQSQFLAQPQFNVNQSPGTLF